MKITTSWLKEHLEFDQSINEVVNTLTMIGLEVEQTVSPMDKLADFKVAEIVEICAHPNADRLKVCSVRTRQTGDAGGDGLVQIVCGASNARAGIKVVLAEVGAIIPNGGFKITANDIRGVKSVGMLCSSSELDLGDDASGIIEVDPQAKVGEVYAKFANLDDTMIEIGLTPNRGDCLGVASIARDLAAGGIGKLKPLKYTKNIDEINKNSFGKSPIKWILETPLSPCVMGVYIRDIKNKQSSKIIKARLKAIGITPKNCLVDATNYISYEFARPLHVFDADKITGNLRIRNAKNGEKMLGLDDIEYTLEESMVVISDDNQVQAIGGIMGAKSSMVSDDTTNAFIESASFDSVNISETGRKLSILSSARYRFERTVDPDSNLLGIEAGLHMIMQTCGGAKSEIEVAGKSDFVQKTITLRSENLKRKSAIDIDAKIVLEIFSALGFEPLYKNGNFICKIPSFRSDVKGEHCLVEEVLRIYGFDKIPEISLPNENSMPKAILSIRQKQIGIARRALCAFAMDEMVSYAFMKKSDAQLFFETGVPDCLIIQNPISQDLNVMRPSILPNLLNAYKKNKVRGHENIALFEYGGTFEGIAENQQIDKISGIRAGRTCVKHWLEKPRGIDVFDAKADAQLVLNSLGIKTSSLKIKSCAPKFYHPQRSGSFMLGQVVVAHFGEIHPIVLKELGLIKEVGADTQSRVVGFEVLLNFAPIPKKKSKTKKQYNPSQLQTVNRDFAFEVLDEVEANEVVLATKSSNKHITDVQVFDVFRGGGVSEGKKSIAIMVTLSPKDKTFRDVEIEQICDEIKSCVVNKTNAVVR